MSRHESESNSRETLPEEQQQTPQPFGTARAQQSQPPLRRPQNFDDWESRRREDDPTR
jgi:hypothetical protein